MPPPDDEPEDAGLSLVQRLARVRLVALDVDGVLTDGGVTYVGEEELMRFCVQDGAGLVRLARAGVAVAWITGRGCRATERRATELGVTELHQRVGDKAQCLEEVQQRLSIAPDATLAMGDDLPDLALASRAATFCAPRNARPEIRERADLVTEARGGSGAVRELCDRILSARDAAAGAEAPR